MVHLFINRVHLFNIDPIAVSTGEPPTEEMMQLVQEYVDGKKEISEILEETIQKYHKIATIES